MGKKHDPEAAVKSYMKKYKRRMKRLLGCGIIWNLLGIACLCIGIAFLAKYHEHWGDETTWRRNLPYAGVGLIIVSLVFAGIGIALCVTLYILYKRMSGGPDTAVFRPPHYEYGKAPYPQQPPMDQPAPAGPPPAQAQPPAQPNAPYPSSPAHPQPPPGSMNIDQSAVHVEVSQHDKF